MDKILIEKQAQQPWIDGAQYVTSIEVDNEDVTYVWRGGSIVNVYNTKGEKIDFFPVGDESSEQEPTQPEIEAAITEHMDELMGMATNANLNKKADYEDNIVNFIGDYFNPDLEQEEALELLGEGENERLNFYDEITNIIRNNPQEYSDYDTWEEHAKESEMEVDDLIFEIIDDELNTRYSLQYDNLIDDEVGRLIKQTLSRINNDWAMYQSDINEEGGE